MYKRCAKWSIQFAIDKFSPNGRLLRRTLPIEYILITLPNRLVPIKLFDFNVLMYNQNLSDGIWARVPVARVNNCVLLHNESE